MKKVKEIKVALLGLGTVGSGVLEMLKTKEDFFLAQGFKFCLVLVGRKKGNDIEVIEKKAGQSISIPNFLECLDKGKDNDNLSLKKNALEDALTESPYDVLIECTPTNLETAEPAYNYITAALKRGKSVITSNKGPIALYHKKLLRLARENKAELKFETTVLSGTPVFNLIQAGLQALKINKISGIFNGTTNYILGQLENGTSYLSALKKAQEIGYAESNPDADVLGYDALAKTIILANVVMGANLTPGDVPFEGITKLTPEEIKQAKAAGEFFKLVGIVEKSAGLIKARVSLERIGQSSPLSDLINVKNDRNGIVLHTEDLKDIFIAGPGAGGQATAYGIINDLMDLSKKKDI